MRQAFVKQTPHLDLSGQWFVSFSPDGIKNRGRVVACVDEYNHVYLVQFWSFNDFIETNQEEIAFADMKMFAFYSTEQDWKNQCSWGNKARMAESRRTPPESERPPQG